MSDPIRSRRARELAESALVRLLCEYGDVPEFVLLGGLVPDLLCTTSSRRHEGTTDIDVQVDLEIQGGSENASRLEGALTCVGFRPDDARIWRWRDNTAPELVVKVEFIADLDDIPNHQTVSFDDCRALGAVNLRGTGFAARHWEMRSITAHIDGVPQTVTLRVATLPAYLLAKTHAAHGRGLPKDWYDIAYVLLHNDDGGPVAAGRRVRDQFGDDFAGATVTALSELSANFVDETAQGSLAFASTTLRIDPALDRDVLANDAVAAVAAFMGALGSAGGVSRGC
ncbi:MAG: nucleotidyl transferase AbiEii/AbiGii toxin family protein [Acidimicrobiales bacterium]